MSRKKKLIIGLVIAFLLGGASGGLYFFHFRPASSPISSAFKKQVPFQIYYPSDKKYKLVKDSLDYDSNAGLAYMKFVYGSDLFTVTQQPKPAEFDQKLFEGTQFITTEGTAILGKNKLDAGRDTGNTGLLITNEQLIIVVVDGTADSIATNSLKYLLSSLHPMK